MSDLKGNQPELWTRGFLGLQLAQFMGAFNDNLVKIVLMLMVASESGNLWAGDLGPGGQSYISLLMTIPFLLLLDFSGRCADRFSKRRIIFWVKVSEIPISIIIAIGLIAGSIWLTLIGYALLMMESAFFNPSKYGMIREVIMTRQLSRGNGLMNMTTNMAIILGTAVGGPLLGFGYWPVGAAIIIISIIGFLGVFVIPPLPAIKPTTALTPWPRSQLYQNAAWYAYPPSCGIASTNPRRPQIPSIASHNNSLGLVLVRSRIGDAYCA